MSHFVEDATVLAADVGPLQAVPRVDQFAVVSLLIFLKRSKSQSARVLKGKETFYRLDFSN